MNPLTCQVMSSGSNALRVESVEHVDEVFQDLGNRRTDEHYLRQLRQGVVSEGEVSITIRLKSLSIVAKPWIKTTFSFI